MTREPGEVGFELPRLLDVAEAAWMLGVSETLVRRLARSGELESVRVRSNLRFTVAAVQAYIEAQSSQHTATARPARPKTSHGRLTKPISRRAT